MLTEQAIKLLLVICFFPPICHYLENFWQWDCMNDLHIFLTVLWLQICYLLFVSIFLELLIHLCHSCSVFILFFWQVKTILICFFVLFISVSSVLVVHHLWSYDNTEMCILLLLLFVISLFHFFLFCISKQFNSFGLLESYVHHFEPHKCDTA